MTQPLVYVLVINWNGLEHLDVCFTSLLASSYDNLRIVLIDNASTDDSVVFVRDTFGSDPRVELLTLEENRGWSRGNNAGLELAMARGADYAFLLNNDTWTAPDAIESLVARAEADPLLGAVAPKMKLFDNPELLNSLGLVCSMIGNTWDLGLGRLDQAKWDAPRDVIGFCGGAALLRVAALRQTGLLPSDYDIYLDDLELSLRIWKYGYTIRTAPEAVVHHKFSATMGREDQRRRKYFLTTRNRLRVVMRHFPKSRQLQIARALAKGEGKALGRAILDRAPWIARAHAQAWFETIRDWPSLRKGRRDEPTDHDAKVWALVDKEHLFYPGTEFPVDGWYQPVQHQGVSLRPISRRARLTVASESLWIHHANPYPRLGGTRVVVVQHGAEVAELSATDYQKTTLRVTPGLLEFESRHLYDADDTGERFDIGGWLRVEPAEGA